VVVVAVAVDVGRYLYIYWQQRCWHRFRMPKVVEEEEEEASVVAAEDGDHRRSTRERPYLPPFPLLCPHFVA
jgi:hypothetical protein